jgi:hypothetical protein
MDSQLAIFQQKCYDEVDYSLNVNGRNDGQVDHEWSEDGKEYCFTLLWVYNELAGIFTKLELYYYIDGGEQPYDFKGFSKDSIFDIERN